MSNRWFILLFSVAFLFVFRIWIDEMRISVETRAIIDVLKTKDIHNITFTPPVYQSMYSTDFGSFSWFENTLATKRNNQYLYIFPVWPDTLEYFYDQAYVNHNPIHSGNRNQILRYTNY